MTVATQPGSPAQTCTVATGTGSGTVTGAVTSVEIDCPPFVVAGGLDGPNTLAVNGSTLYFGVSVYPTVSNCYAAQPGAGDRVLMVPTSGGTPAPVDYLDNSGGNCGLYGFGFDSTYVYWANYSTGNIKKFPLAGGSATLVAQVSMYCNALALGGGNLFWHSYPNSWLGQISTAGTGSVEFTTTASINGQTLATDGSYLYWTDYAAGTVNKVSFGASPLPASPTAMVSGETNPLSAFVTSTSIFWIEPGASGNLRSAALASPAAATLNTTPLAGPSMVVADSSHAWVIAAGSGTGDGRIYKIPVGGGAPVVVAQGLTQPTTIAIDAGHVYWTNNNTTTGGTRNSDGTIMMMVK